MTKQRTIVTTIVVFSLLWISSEAFATYADRWSVPSWMLPFADSQPVYRFDWSFGMGNATTDINGNWVNIGLNPHAGQSRADGTAYTGEGQCYWTSISGGLNGFSVSNDIGAWMDAIGTGQAVIRYTIREDYSGTGSVDNNDVIELFDNENEWLRMPGSTPGGANLGVGSGDDITALEWNVNFDEENLSYDHVNALGSATYSAGVWLDRNMDDETVYATFGATAQLDGEGVLTGTTRYNKGWIGGNYGGYVEFAHNADICYETRTYDPIRNADGPESPYEWLYDASGDMYVPTNGTGLPGDTPLERATKLIGNHPFWVDDDAVGEYETSTDFYIWQNKTTGVGSREGVLTTGIFVDSWRLAGEMLGQEFWNDDPDYWWDPDDGRVEDELNAAVAGYDELNDFMRYVFDIDALVVEDNGVEGEFEEGDYVLFSVVDDGLYSQYEVWGGGGDIDSFFSGEYFDGDTIFLYDGTSVTTYFDAATGVFFGSAISTATGYGVGSTLWSMYDIYDLDALDIGILPEPSTIFLMIGSASGLAVVAGLMRRKLR